MSTIEATNTIRVAYDAVITQVAALTPVNPAGVEKYKNKYAAAIAAATGASADADMAAAHWIDAAHAAEMISFCALWHEGADKCICVPGEVITHLLSLRAAYLGKIAPDCKLECDDGRYNYTTHYMAGCAALNLHDWLRAAYDQASSVEDYNRAEYDAGVVRPGWVDEALDLIRKGRALREQRRDRYADLATAAYNDYKCTKSGDATPAPSISDILFGQCRSQADICEDIDRIQTDMNALPTWARCW